jgi:hypothetical protein
MKSLTWPVLGRPPPAAVPGRAVPEPGFVVPVLARGVPPPVEGRAAAEPPLAGRLAGWADRDPPLAAGERLAPEDE